jgi:hypothetical protein
MKSCCGVPRKAPAGRLHRSAGHIGRWLELWLRWHSTGGKGGRVRWLKVYCKCCQKGRRKPAKTEHAGGQKQLWGLRTIACIAHSCQLAQGAGGFAAVSQEHR